MVVPTTDYGVRRVRLRHGVVVPFTCARSLYERDTQTWHGGVGVLVGRVVGK